MWLLALRALRVRVAKNLIMRFIGVFGGRRKPAHAERLHVTSAQTMGVTGDKSMSAKSIYIYIYIYIYICAGRPPENAKNT